MNIDFDLFLRALALCFILEGIAIAGFPDGMREAFAKALTLSKKEFQSTGVFGILLGFLLLWLVAH